MFSIDAKNPTCLKLISTAGSGGDFPCTSLPNYFRGPPLAKCDVSSLPAAALAVNDEGTMACVINSGTDNGLSCFTIDPEVSYQIACVFTTIRFFFFFFGSFAERPRRHAELEAFIRAHANDTSSWVSLLSSLLLFISPSNFDTSRPTCFVVFFLASSSPAGTPSDIIFDNSGNLLVSIKGFNATSPGYLGRLNISANHTLSDVAEKFTPNGGALPFSITSPKELGDGSTVFTTDPAIGIVTFDLASNPPKSNGTVVPGEMAVRFRVACWTPTDGR